MKILKVFGCTVAVGSTFLLMGCATYSKSQCESFDWREKGQETALRGNKISVGADHFRNTCEKDHGIKTDSALFLAGYQQGLKQFCTKAYGEEHGARGGTYMQICPKSMEADFLSGYQPAKLGYVSGRLEELENEITSLRSEIDQKNSQISDLESHQCR